MIHTYILSLQKQKLALYFAVIFACKFVNMHFCHSFSRYYLHFRFPLTRFFPGSCKMVDILTFSYNFLEKNSATHFYDVKFRIDYSSPPLHKDCFSNN